VSPGNSLTTMFAQPLVPEACVGVGGVDIPRSWEDAAYDASHEGMVKFWGSIR